MNEHSSACLIHSNLVRITGADYEIESTGGELGEWSSPMNPVVAYLGLRSMPLDNNACPPNYFMTGAQLNSEKPQGDGHIWFHDDTARKFFSSLKININLFCQYEMVTSVLSD